MAKPVLYFQGKYYQGSLTNDQAQSILTLVSDYSVVSSLKHSITDLPDFLITDIKKDAESYQAQHGSLQGFVKDYGQLPLGTLRDEQTVGVAFMYYAGSALLGDEVGLGKTVQIAGLCNVLQKQYKKQGRDFHFCFLTEKSSVHQIRDKMIKFTGQYVGLLESGEKKVIEGYLQSNVDSRHYSIVGSHSLVNSPDFLSYAAQHPFDLIVFDESSIIKSSSSDLYTNCKALFKFHKRKILLNATPIELAIEEIYNQLNLLDPGYMPTKTEFTKTYSKFKRTPFGFKADGYKNEQQFRDAVRLRYLARTREELGATYTDNQYKTILVPLSPVQKELRKKTTLLQAVTDYPPGVDRNVPFNEDTTPKLAVLLHLLKDSIDMSSSQALIYCRFVDAQAGIRDILVDKGYRVAVLNGQVGIKNRAAIINAVNAGDYNVLVTNVLRGIDLKACDNCILYTIDPNPQKMVQFEGRMTREFNIEYKSVYLLVAMGREKKFVEQTLKLRVNASAAFSKTSKSMVLEAINSESNREMYDSEQSDASD